MPSAGMFSRLDTVILRVRDLRAARAWYEQVLGFASAFVDEEEERLVVFDLGGTTSLTIWQLKPGEQLPERGSASAYPIFLSQNAADARLSLEEMGVEVEALQTGGGVTSFGFFDPDGNRLEVCEVAGE